MDSKQAKEIFEKSKTHATSRLEEKVPQRTNGMLEETEGEENRSNPWTQDKRKKHCAGVQ